MAPAQPSPLAVLAALKQDRLIRLTPRDAVRVEALLASRERWRPDVLCSSLASLLATDRESWHQIHERLHALLGVSEPQAGAATGGSATRRHASLQAERALELVALPPRRRAAPRRHNAMRLACAYARRLTAQMMRLPGGVWAALVAVVALTALSPLIVRTPDPPPTITKDAGPPDAGGHDAGPLPQPVIEVVEIVPERSTAGTERVSAPAVGSTVSRLLLAAIGLVTWLLALLGLRWFVLPRQARQFVTRLREGAHQRRAKVSREASTRGVPYLIERTPPFAESAMDDAATLLGRVGAATSTTHIDVMATVDRTVRAGGLLEPVFATLSRSHSVLVFVDVEKGDHPFLDSVDWVLARWQKTGLPIVRYDYKYIPEKLRPASGGKRVSLEQLGRHRAGATLLVFSRLSFPYDASGRLGWLAHLTPWPARVLFDLDPRFEHERPYEALDALQECARAGLPRYAFTAAGLECAARALSIGQVPAEFWDPVDPLDARGVEQAVIRWATCAVLVPDPTWIQLEAIRRRIKGLAVALPDRAYVQRLIDWVSERSGRAPVAEGERGRRLQVPVEVQDRLIADQRRADRARRREDTLEWHVRTLLIKQLEEATPASEFEKSQRDLKLAFHRAVLEPALADKLLARFAGSEVDSELRNMLAQEKRLQRDHGATLVPWPAATWETASAWVEQRGRVPVRGLARPVIVSGAVSGAVRRRAFMLALAAASLGVVAASWALALQPEVVTRDLPGGYIVPRTLEIIDHRLLDGDETRPDVGIAADLDAPPMRFVRLSGGEFTMGSPDSEVGRYDNEIRHRVRVSAFEIAEKEVTQLQWRIVMGTNPSDCDYGCDDDMPVQNVSWFDAVEFMNKLSRLENRTLCYDIQGENVTWKAGCNGYRLPTEAEWEYAARAGTVTAYSFGDDAAMLKEYAWYDENSDGKVHPVGTRKPNAWGLYDMHGNVWEWVWDWYGSYSKEPSSNPRGPASGAARVLRGGSFGFRAGGLRSADRDRPRTRLRFGGVGVRCARGGAPTLSPRPLDP